MEPLRRESDLAVALVHSGMDGSGLLRHHRRRGRECRGVAGDAPVRPDLVVVGHSHREMRDSVIGGVHFVQPRPYRRQRLDHPLDLVRQDDGGGRCGSGASSSPPRDVAPSTRVVQRLAPAHAAVLAWSDTPLGRATGPMRAGRGPGGADPDSQLHQCGAAEADRSRPLCRVGLRSSRPASTAAPIRMGQVVALYPFDNTLRAVRVTGAQLKEYLEHSARYFRADPVGRISINDSVPGLQLRRDRRRTLRYRPATPGGRPDPEPGRRRTPGAAGPTASPLR